MADQFDTQTVDLGDLTVTVQTENANLDPNSGALVAQADDGSAVVTLNPQAETSDEPADPKFDDNLAETISKSELSRIAEEILQGIAADEQSRSEWLENRAKGIDLLGFKMEEPRGDTGASTAPVEGMSTVRHPLLAEAVIRFQSNASAELLPAGGPVKVRNDSVPQPAGMDPDPAPGVGHNGGPPLDAPDPDSPEALLALVDQDDDDPDDSAPPSPPPLPPLPPGISTDDLAEALEKDFNHYLTVTDKGYRPDTDRMLFWTGFGGCGFKKVYRDPIKRMPLSRAVDAEDLIVSNQANDLDDAGRVTHKLRMRKSQIVRMQLAGAYRETTLTQPQEVPTMVDDKKAEVQGFTPRTHRPEDALYTVYECYCELDIQGHEHKSDGKVTGLQLPYRVTIEKDSREVLEVRRNWKEDDEDCLPKKTFVKYPFIPAFGFYEIGLLHVLGNADRALTGAWRLMLDAGMFASFPGFLFADFGGRQATNEFRVPPGGGVKIQTGNRPIGDVVQPLPYKEPSQALQMLAQTIEKTAQRVGGTAEVMVGEGKQDMPVGTTLALLEQAGKMLAAVHVRLHSAQAEEFSLLRERFQEDPGAFWRRNKRPAQKWTEDMLLAALENFDLVPAADPNVSSRTQRIMSAVAVKQLQMAAPQLYDGKAVDTAILRLIGIQNPDSLFNKNPNPAPADPSAMDAQVKQQEIQQKAALQAQEAAQHAQEFQAESAQKDKDLQARADEVAAESGDRAADRESRERVAAMKLQSENARAEQARQDKAQGGVHDAIGQAVMWRGGRVI